MSAENDSAEQPSRELRSFGRRRGRKLSPKQMHLLENLLPTIAVDLSRSPAEQISTGSSIWLEIGFGGAEHLLWQAQQNPDQLLIGCEPFEEGVVKALAGIEKDGLRNVRLHTDDARPLLRWLPPQSVERCFILFPDPWPKRKHVKRRLVSPQTLALLARVLKPAAELRIGTDIGGYARTILLAMSRTSAFEWRAEGPADWRVRPRDWPQTRYEAKAHREGRRCYYMTFLRTNGV